jgi:uncharacterized membrane protein YraQ (UPF0718 family)
MPARIAATTSFIVFAVCLIAGAGNTFGDAVGRALVAMMATLVVGLIVGWMAQKMIDENIEQHAKTVAEAAPVPEIAVPASDNKGAKTAVKKDQGKPPKRGR